MAKMYSGQATPMTEYREHGMEFDEAAPLYKMVARQVMQKFELDDEDLLLDAGAKRTFLDFFLRRNWGWKGMYLPVDGMLDGTDMKWWTPRGASDYAVSVYQIGKDKTKAPATTIADLEKHTYIGVMFVVPMPGEKWGDPDYTTDISPAEWEAMGYDTERHTFLKQRDTIVAWKMLEQEDGD